MQIKNESVADSTASSIRSTRSKKSKKTLPVPPPQIIKIESAVNATFSAEINAQNITPESVYEDAVETDAAAASETENVSHYYSVYSKC